MRACSLLVIPPPLPGMPARHLEIPMDLNTMRLPDWVNNVWDLTTGLVMLPPTFLVTGKVIQSSVLPKLERVAGVKSCRFCLHPHSVQIVVFEKRQSQLTPQGGAFPSLSGAPSAPPVQLGHFCLGTQQILKERDGKRMPTGYTCITSP